MAQKEPIGSRMAVGGHPIHPTMVHFPVAALLGLLATDVVFLLTEDFFWARMGFWLVTVGAWGGWVAGLVGLIDLVSVRSISQLVGAWSHAILAVMTLSLASFNWLLRFENHATHIGNWGAYLSAITALLLMVTGFLGGQLVYDQGVGVDLEEEG